MSGSADSTRVVVAALLGNVLIALSKFVAAFVTGSAATLAEAVHSCADTGNQILLLFGMRLADQAPTERHPFGRSVERYFWAFVVSLILFSIGGVFAIVEGWHKLRETDPGLHHSNLWSYVVLGVSFALESYSFKVATTEFRKIKGKRTALQAIRETRDPTIPLVVMEDFSALVGLAIALAGIGLSDLTGWGGCDGIASLLIGVLLCISAFVLARETHSLLVGEGATEADRKKVREIAEAVTGVRRLTQMLSLHLGPEDVILALKVDFMRELSVDELERTTDEIEVRIREALPRMRHIFIEPDSAYVAQLDGAHPHSIAAPPRGPE